MIGVKVAVDKEQAFHRPTQWSLWSPLLRRLNDVRIKYHAHLTAEKIEQYGHAFLAAHGFEQAKGVGEGAVAYANLVACSKTRSSLKLDKAIGILAPPQPLN